MSEEQQQTKRAAVGPASEPIIERPGIRAIPDATETRRQAIMKESDYWREGPRTKALRDEMQRLVADPSATAKSAPAIPPTSAAEQRLAAANKNPALWDKNHKDHDKARAELRAAVAGANTPEEAQALKGATLDDNRSVYGLAAPAERILPKAWAEEYQEQYSGHENDFLSSARAVGLEAPLVRELRDVGIRLAIEADGRPVTEEAWGAAVRRFEGRLTTVQQKALRAWWRAEVEGGGAA